MMTSTLVSKRVRGNEREEENEDGRKEIRTMMKERRKRRLMLSILELKDGKENC